MLILWTGINAATALIHVQGANKAREHAVQAEGAIALLEADAARAEAWAEFWGSPPLIGGAIERLYLAASDRDHCLEQARTFRELDASIERSGALTEQWKREAEIARIEAGLPAEPPAPTSEGRGVEIIDGDTIRVPHGSTMETVRLLSIDTPERGQPGFDEATAALKALVGGRDVFLVFEANNESARDHFGRTLAYVMVGASNANLEMVRQGWSAYYTEYGEGRFPDLFRAAEAEARAAGRGLWATDAASGP